MVYRQTQRSEKVRAAARFKILRAARKLFANKGFDATTIQDVVAAARTSTGNLYFYFRNKDDLLWAVVQDSATAVVTRGDELVAAAPKGPARLAVLVFLNLHLALGQHRELTQILMVGVSREIVYDRIIDGFAGRLRNYLRANFPDLPEENVELTVSSWGGAVIMCLERQVLGRLDAEPLRIAEFVVRWNLRGLGVPEKEIDSAIAVATRSVLEEAATPKANRDVVFAELTDGS